MKAPVKDYRDLVTWQKAMDLVVPVYRQVRELPKEETYALGAQIRRAIVSVPANIAEGHSRKHTKEFLQHISIARGSLAELSTLLEIAVRLHYLPEAEVRQLQDGILEVRRLTAGLTSRLMARETVP